MRWSELQEAVDVNLDGVDMTSMETFVQSMPRLPREQVVALNNVLLARRSEHEKKFSGMATLYHGAPERAFDSDKKLINIHADITTNGFKLTKGRRGGAFGSTYFVENLGIFLTDSKPLAHFFGNNRDDHGRGRVIECKTDISRLLDSSTAKGELLKLGCALLNKYNGTTKTRLALRDWWWLVDQQRFVDYIKALGHTGIKFKEETSVRRNANAFDGHTYFIFDPASIHVQTTYTVGMFYEELKRGHA